MKASRIEHTHVTVKKDSVTRFYAYTLDHTLGRIVYGSMQSQLYLTYLHAITSTCLPDSLTNYTWTEASLEILRSAAIWSFDALTQEKVGLVACIAGLSVYRSFYPEHIREMQRIN
jgi:hypothetical protein